MSKPVIDSALASAWPGSGLPKTTQSRTAHGPKTTRATTAGTATRREPPADAAPLHQASAGPGRGRARRPRSGSARRGRGRPRARAAAGRARRRRRLGRRRIRVMSRRAARASAANGIVESGSAPNRTAAGRRPPSARSRSPACGPVRAAARAPRRRRRRVARRGPGRASRPARPGPGRRRSVGPRTAIAGGRAAIGSGSQTSKAGRGKYERRRLEAPDRVADEAAALDHVAGDADVVGGVLGGREAEHRGEDRPDDEGGTKISPTLSQASRPVMRGTAGRRRRGRSGRAPRPTRTAPAAVGDRPACARRSGPIQLGCGSDPVRSGASAATVSLRSTSSQRASYARATRSIVPIGSAGATTPG